MTQAAYYAINLNTKTKYDAEILGRARPAIRMRQTINAGEPFMMNTLLKTLYSFLFISCTWALSAAAGAEELNATVDRRVISLDETLTLTLQYNGNSARGTPDFSKLEQNFSILSRQSGNKIFGDMNNLTSLTEWTLVLSPKVQGEFMIPVFSYGKLKSAPITIKVEKEKTVPQGQVKDIFIETTLEKNSVYVQEQLILTYRLFYSINVDSLERDPIEIPDVIMEQLPDVRYNRTINGKTYGIAEFNYALYPQTSEDFEIPSFTWGIKIPKSRRSRSTFFDFNGRYEVKRLRTEAQTVTVRPKSPRFPDGTPWLPAKSLSLEEKWSQDPQSFKIGEPITRTLRLKAEGLTAAQLPQIWPSKNEGALKVYTDQPDLNDEKLADGAVAQRTESAAVVVSEAGTIELPPIRVPWWDVKTDSLQYAELPGRTLTIAATADSQSGDNGSVNGVSDTTSNALSESDMAALSAAHTQIWRWRLISLMLSLALLALIVRQFFIRPTHESPTSDGPTNHRAAFSKLQQACKDNVPDQIRLALMNWANHEWPDNTIATFDELSQRIDNTELTRALRNLDAVQYAAVDTAHPETQQPKVDGQVIIKAIKAYAADKNASANTGSLETFYAR